MRRSGKVSGGKQNQALWGGEYGQDKKSDGMQWNAELVVAQTCYHSKRGPVYFLLCVYAVSVHFFFYLFVEKRYLHDL